MPFGFEVDKPTTPRFWLTVMAVVATIVAAVWITVQVKHASDRSRAEEHIHYMCDHWNVNCPSGYTRTPLPVPGGGGYIYPCNPDQLCATTTPGTPP